MKHRNLLQQKLHQLREMIRLFASAGNQSTRPTAQRGLIMIQIDGLGEKPFMQGLNENRMPYLQKLISRNNYTLQTLYSGLPSSTPAVQGELFYGIRTLVPAYGYYDRKQKRLIRTFGTGEAQRLEHSLANTKNKLLETGSAYANIFTGGSSRAEYCFSSLGISLNRAASVLRVGGIPALVRRIPGKISRTIRAAVLTVLEAVLAVYAMLIGLIHQKNILKELTFIPARVAVCGTLREVVTGKVREDIAAKIPVIHANFLGYDEQSHRRGPDSGFAHWTLRGIDDAIRRIGEKADTVQGIDYELWVYSDHGQIKTNSFEAMHGVSLPAAVRRITEEMNLPFTGVFTSELDISLSRVNLLHPQGHRDSADETEFAETEGRTSPTPQEGIRIAIGGPVTHVYLPDAWSISARRRFSRELSRRWQIPLIARVEPKGTAFLSAGAQQQTIPGDEEVLFGSDHPFIKELSRDLIALTEHTNAGDLIFFGWAAGSTPLSFTAENGAHGGFSPQETAGAALLPRSLTESNTRGFLRPLDLRREALSVLDREKSTCRTKQQESVHPFPHRPLRITTYNIHSCIGMDGYVSTERIAEIIRRCDPDIAALQEVDRGRQVSAMADQTQELAEKTGMFAYYFPSRTQGGAYGNAILSRYPLQQVQTGILAGPPRSEQRSAQWYRLSTQAGTISIINTHLGYRKHEKRQQIQDLLKNWVDKAPKEPLILCGDFNATPKSKEYRILRAELADCLSGIPGDFRTWMNFSRLDHIFISSDLSARSATVPNTALSRKSSDHAPLSVEVTLRQEK
ncbi:MAG: endonuclease/exonuclease/phosphatase family protein [Fibrobacterota bacterium]